MTELPSQRRGLGLLGIGAAACVACCAGPILALLGAISVAGLASTTFLGAAGLVIAGMAAVVFVAVRHRRVKACATPPGPVAVPAPSRHEAR